MSYSGNTNGTTSSGVLQALTVATSNKLATREGRSYLAATGVQDIATGNNLAIVLDNPVGSGKRLHLHNRWFDNNRQGGDAPLEYQAFVQPTLTLSTAIGSPNLLFGSPNASVASVTMETGNITSLGGVEASGGQLPTNGMRFELDLYLILPPGNKVGFIVQGAGGGLATTARAAITLLWWEEADAQNPMIDG